MGTEKGGPILFLQSQSHSGMFHICLPRTPPDPSFLSQGNYDKVRRTPGCSVRQMATNSNQACLHVVQAQAR